MPSKLAIKSITVLFFFILLGAIIYGSALAGSPDDGTGRNFADNVDSTTTSYIQQQVEALGASDGQRADILGLLNQVLVLDLGEGEAGTGDLKIYYGGGTVAPRATIEFLNENHDVIGSQVIKLKNHGDSNEITVKNPAPGSAYRYVRFHSNLLGVYHIDAIEALP